MLEQARGKVLIDIARGAIAEKFGAASKPLPQEDWLRRPGATFVTLTEGGDLRGCIGSLQAHRALAEDVRHNAVSAAFEDPRFLPLAREELPLVKVEISLLTATQPLAFVDEADALAQLRPGVDGVVFEYSPPDTLLVEQLATRLGEQTTLAKSLVMAEPADCGRGGLAAIPAPKGFAPPSHGRHYRSTFLPQVWEHFPQPREFLAMLKRKAGLPDDFWSDEVKLSRYGVSKWKETEQG